MLDEHVRGLPQQGERKLREGRENGPALRVRNNTEENDRADRGLVPAQIADGGQCVDADSGASRFADGGGREEVRASKRKGSAVFAQELVTTDPPPRNFIASTRPLLLERPFRHLEAIVRQTHGRLDAARMR